MSLHAAALQSAPRDDARLWAAWRERADHSARQQLIARHLDFARIMAGRLFAGRTHRQLEFDDYLQFARVGLLEAVDRFDAALGVKFETFAAPRINGAILDGIARYSDMQEQIAARQRVVAQRAASLADEAPALRDAAALFSYLADVAVGLAVGLALEDTGMVQTEAAAFESGYRAVELRQLHRRLVEMIRELPARPQLVLSWHYLQQRSFDELAAELGVSKGRVAQLHRDALQLLRERWRLRDKVDWQL